MKHLISQNGTDFIIKSRVVEKYKKDEQGRNVTDWVDKENNKANCKRRIEGVYMLVQENDQFGNGSNIYRQVWIDLETMKKVIESAKEIEVDLVGTPEDDLPF